MQMNLFTLHITWGTWALINACGLVVACFVRNSYICHFENVCFLESESSRDNINALQFGVA